MADSTNNITLPTGETIAIPAWASETTLLGLVAQMQLSNDIDKKLVDVIKGNAVDTSNISQSVRDAFKKLRERRQQDSEDENKRTAQLAKSLAKRTSDIVGKFSNTEAPLTSLVDAAKTASAGFGKSLTGLKDAGGSMGALGKTLSNWAPGVEALGDAAFAWLGFNAAKIEQFAKAQESMINSGVVFNQGAATYEDLYTTARKGGITYTQLAGIAGEYGQTLQMFGGGVSRGTQVFAEMFKEVNRSADSFGDFGMSNEQMAKAFADYITVARNTGEVNRNTNNAQVKLQNGFRDLMLETGALASLTGKSRDELLQARAAALSAPQIAAALRRMEENYGEGAKFTTGAKEVLTQLAYGQEQLGGVGTILSNAIGAALATTADHIEDFDVKDALVGMGGEATTMMQALQTSGSPVLDQINEAIRTGQVAGNDISKFILDGIRTAGQNTIIMAQGAGDALSPINQALIELRTAGTLLDTDMGNYLNMSEEQTSAALSQYKRDIEEAGKTTEGFNNATMAVLAVQDALTVPLDFAGDAADALGSAMLASVQAFDSLFGEKTTEETPIASPVDQADISATAVRSMGVDGFDPTDPYRDPALDSMYQSNVITIRNIEPFDQARFDELGGEYEWQTHREAALDGQQIYKHQSGITMYMPPGRFSGGSVSANTPYMVGENRPGGLGELFVPDQSGFIMSHEQTSEMMQNRINTVLGLANAFNTLQGSIPNVEIAAKQIVQLTELASTIGNSIGKIINFGGSSSPNSTVFDNATSQMPAANNADPIGIRESQATANNAEPIGIRASQAARINTDTIADAAKSNNTSSNSSIDEQVRQITEIKRKNLEIMRNLEEIIKRYTRRSDPLRA